MTANGMIPSAGATELGPEGRHNPQSRYSETAELPVN